MTSPSVPYNADERTLLEAFLGQYRSTLLAQTDGLDAGQLHRRLPGHASTMTLGGMVKHLAYVEDWWFGVNLAGEPPSAPWDTVDWDADNDWDWNSAPESTPAELRQLLTDAIARSEKNLAAADSLDVVAVRRHPRTGEGISARWIVVHMIEEYARHCGHADLLREAIDGATAL